MLTSAFKGPSFAIILLVALAMAGTALLITDPYYQLVLSTVPIWATVALSWNLFSGYTGLISFGHATFFGLGAFAVALLSVEADITPWLGLVVATFIGGLAAVFIGAITFRLRGHYFALAMLAYPSLFIFLFDWMGWQELTLPFHREGAAFHMQFADPRVHTLIGIVLMTGVLVLTLFVERSRFGLSMMSIKQNEFAAEAAGIDTFRVKMLGFILAGSLGGLVGGLHAVVLQVVTPHGVLGTMVSAQALILSLFGGIGTLWGPVIGASVLVPLTETLRAELGHILPGIQGVIYGLVIMLVVIVAPEGLYWRARDRWARSDAKATSGTRPLGRPDAAVDAPVAPASRPAPGARLLEVKGLSKSFGGLKAVQGVTFEVFEGEILGIIGPNGAGKTTLFNLLNGFQKPTAGAVRFGEETITGWSPNRVCRAGVGRTFQVARPFLRMSVLNNVVVGALASSRTGDEALAAARASLELVGMGGKAEAGVGTLTNLELRLMELARALASRPRLILLDETLAGLGAGEVEEILPIIQRLPAAGVTVIIIEHTMHAMTRLANRFVVLDHGQLIAEGAPGEVMASPAVVEAYLGKKWMKLHAAA